MSLIEGQEVELMGVFLPRLKRSSRKAVTAWRKRFRLFGAEPTWEDVAIMSGAFLPGLKNVFKKIGKFTAPITTKIAKTFLPSSIVDAAAKLDPTKPGQVTPKAVAAVQELVKAKEAGAAVPAGIPSPTQVKIEALTKTLTNPLVLGIAGAGIIAIILLRKRR